MKTNATTMLLAIVCMSFVARPADAHFPWLAIDSDGKVIFFFGENPADQSYKMPATISAAKIHATGVKGKPQPVKTEAVDSENFVGLKSVEPVKEVSQLTTKVTYGVYQGSRLDYYSVHQTGKLPASRKAYKKMKSKLSLRAELVDTEDGVDVFVLYKGKPLAGKKVMLYCEDGHEEGKATTDFEGKVSFNNRQVEDGLNGIMVGHTIEDSPGKLGEKEYKGVFHYLTITFADPEDFE